ncbi:MAG TPA: hypothetical protein DDX39_09165, partial [Bacteroidales bacterium]|nr:hypothetical protein [Bacteroidales bacterium]
MKNLYVSFLFSILFVVNAYSQDWNWLGQGECTGGTFNVRASKVDNSDNLYVFGDYSGTLTIQGTPLAPYGGVTDMFLAKFNSLGTLQWAVRAGSATGAENGMGMDIDSNGDVYITGGFAATTTFNDVGPVTIVNSNVAGQDVFIAKYNSSGALQWVSNVATGVNNQRATDIIVDNNELIIVGFYTNGITFTGGPTVALVGTRDFFIAKYDNAGAYVWEHHYTSTSANSNLTSLAKHDGIGYYVSGSLAGNFTFDDGSTTLSSTLTTEKDVLLFKVDTDGDLLWAKDVGGVNGDESKEIQVDADGNVYSAGYINGTDISFDGNLVTTDGIDFYITKRSPLGALYWVTHSAQPGTDQIYSLSLLDDNIYVSGSFTDTLTIGDDQLISSASTEPFIAVFDNSGNPINANSLVGVAVVADESQAIAVDTKGNSYISGYFVSKTLTGNAITITDANTDALPDMFLAQYNWIISMSNSDVVCNGDDNGTATATAIGGIPPYTYLWSDGQTTQTAIGLVAGDYAVTITDSDIPATSASDSVTISEPLAALSLSSVITHPSCNGDSDGEIDLIIAGGTSPYTILWSNAQTIEDISGLVAGNYYVTVYDANNCLATHSATLTNPTALSATAIATNISCNGLTDGTIDVTVSGGTGLLTYAWDNSIETTQDLSALAANTYEV